MTQGSPPLPPLPPDARAALGLPDVPEPAPEPAAAPAAKPLRSVSPGPATNTGGHELRVTATVGTGREVMRHAGFNAGSAANAFEQRVVPQDGQH